MSIVTLDEAKAHLRVDGAEEDDDIGLKLAAAEEAIIRHLDRPVPWTDGAGAPVPVPATIKLAILMLLGDLYANRESAIVGTQQSVNQTLARMLSPYRDRSWA